MEAGEAVMIESWKKVEGRRRIFWSEAKQKSW